MAVPDGVVSGNGSSNGSRIGGSKEERHAELNVTHRENSHVNVCIYCIYIGYYRITI